MAFKSHLPTSSLWLAKLALLPLLLLLAARLLVPLATTLPALRTYLAPPYLFATINFIILTIWKLSEKGQRQPSQPTSHKPKLEVVSQPSQTKQEGPPTWSPPHPAPTQDHDPPLPVEPPPCPEPVAPSNLPEEEEEEEALSMDDTWRKITGGMRRSETFKERRRPEAVKVKKWETFKETRDGEAASLVELQMGQDDLNRRFEALIRRMKNESSPPQQLNRSVRFEKGAE